MSISDRIRIRNERVLSDNHYLLKRVTFEWRHVSGEWQTLQREVYDRGNAATVLPYSLARRTVVPWFASSVCPPMSTETTISSSRPPPGCSTTLRQRCASAPRPKRKSAIACATS